MGQSGVPHGTEPRRRFWGLASQHRPFFSGTSCKGIEGLTELKMKFY